VGWGGRGWGEGDVPSFLGRAFQTTGSERGSGLGSKEDWATLGGDGGTLGEEEKSFKKDSGGNILEATREA